MVDKSGGRVSDQTLQLALRVLAYVYLSLVSLDHFFFFLLMGDKVKALRKENDD